MARVRAPPAPSRAPPVDPKAVLPYHQRKEGQGKVKPAHALPAYRPHRFCLCSEPTRLHRCSVCCRACFSERCIVLWRDRGQALASPSKQFVNELAVTLCRRRHRPIGRCMQGDLGAPAGAAVGLGGGAHAMQSAGAEPDERARTRRREPRSRDTSSRAQPPFSVPPSPSPSASLHRRRAGAGQACAQAAGATGASHLRTTSLLK